MTAYYDFLTAKGRNDRGNGLEIGPSELHPALYPFQRDLVHWALILGRAAIFADCGLGKTLMQLAWAHEVYKVTGRPVLILTPLAVSYQTADEAKRFGIPACISRTGDLTAEIVIVNYERLSKFDSQALGGIVCDESSILKSFDGVTRRDLTYFMKAIPFRLLCTATAAPNDYTELGTSSEALGYLGHMDMLSRFFTNRRNTSHPVRGRAHDIVPWRFKGHAEIPFWRWISSWARAMRKPSDLGYDDNGFNLPDLAYRRHMIGNIRPPEGMLFAMPAVGLREERDELRRSLTERCELAATLVEKSDYAVVWCHLNDESRLLRQMIPGAIEVTGQEPTDSKEEKLRAFSAGEARVLITKPSIAGWGLNWQHCAHMTFFPSHSYEQFYQSIRRCWRFGQKRSVTVDIVATEGGLGTVKNLERKAAQASKMFDSLLIHMRQAETLRVSDDYPEEVCVPTWAS
jgi:hypothetical protein